MADYGETVFEACYAGFPNQRCKVRLDSKTVIERALSAGLQFSTAPSDQGVAIVIAGNVRLLSSEEPRKIAVEEKIEVKRTQDADYIPARVAARMETAGAVRLDLESEYQT